uniref:SRPBCC family protein n=1 Tax=Okeanomitos corallinicola TaxID=3231550 RepID=UPI003EBDD648
MTTENQTTEFDSLTPIEKNGLEPNLNSDIVSIQVEKLAERQRQITAQVKIPHPIEKVWKILTDYESLPQFIPNLAKSCLLEHPHGGIRLEQVGSQQLLKFKFCARVVLDLEEIFPKLINFQMVEGDFKGFSGQWCLEPYSLNIGQGTILCYTIQVWPKLTMPISIIEHRLSKDLQLNLLAIRQRAMELSKT